jgi:hypothetical protein
VEVRVDHAECEWIARPGDSWDSNLAVGIAERNVSMQALRDAIGVRDLLFQVLPKLRTAAMRVYRKPAPETLELIITGAVTRQERAPKSIRSLAMKAKLLGFRFWLDDGVLENLECEEYAVNS